MKFGFLLAMTVCVATSAATGQEISTQKSLTKPMRVAFICFKTGEKVSGMNKICYYDCLGSEAAITISSVQLCPLSIEQ